MDVFILRQTNGAAGTTYQAAASQADAIALARSVFAYQPAAVLAVVGPVTIPDTQWRPVTQTLSLGAPGP